VGWLSLGSLAHPGLQLTLAIRTLARERLDLPLRVHAAARNAALASSRLSATPPIGPSVGPDPAIGALLRPPARGKFAERPNVRLPIPIPAFRAQGRFSQLSARSRLSQRSEPRLFPWLGSPASRIALGCPGSTRSPFGTF